MKPYLYCLLFVLIFPTTMATTINVNINHPSCSDGYTRGQAENPDTPWCSFQSIVTNITDGDDFQVHGGVYNDENGFTFQNLNFSTMTKIRCSEGDECLITQIGRGWNITPSGKWTNVTTDKGNTWKATAFTTSFSSLHITRLDTNESFFIYDDDYHKFFLVTNLEAFNNSDNPAGAFFNTTTDYLYLRFEDVTDNPNNIPIGISKQIGAIVLENVTNLTITGFTFKFAKYGLNVRYCHHCNFSNNEIQAGLGSIKIHHSDNTIISDSILYSVVMEDYPWYWQTINGINMYLGYENIRIESNSLHRFFDGMSIVGNPYVPGRNYKDLIIKNNDIQIIFDDGLEIEGQHNNATISNNNISSAFVGISLIPLNSSQGTSHFNDNIILINRSTYWNSTKGYVYGRCYKGGVNTLSQNLSLKRNTCYGTGYGATMVDKVQRSINFSDNLFVNNGSTIIEYTGASEYGNFWDYNLYYHPNMSKTLFSHYNNLSYAGNYITIEQALNSSDWPGNWDLNSKNISPGIDLYYKITSLEQLRPTSGEVCTMSSTGSYVGAMACHRAIFNQSLSLTKASYDLAGADFIIDGITFKSTGTIRGIGKRVLNGKQIFSGKLVMGS